MKPAVPISSYNGELAGSTGERTCMQLNVVALPGLPGSSTGIARSSVPGNNFAVALNDLIAPGPVTPSSGNTAAFLAAIALSPLATPIDAPAPLAPDTLGITTPKPNPVPDSGVGRNIAGSTKSALLSGTAEAALPLTPGIIGLAPIDTHTSVPVNAQLTRGNLIKLFPGSAGMTAAEAPRASPATAEQSTAPPPSPVIADIATPHSTELHATKAPADTAVGQPMPGTAPAAIGDAIETKTGKQRPQGADQKIPETMPASAGDIRSAATVKPRIMATERLQPDLPMARASVGAPAGSSPESADAKDPAAAVSADAAGASTSIPVTGLAQQGPTGSLSVAQTSKSAAEEAPPAIEPPVSQKPIPSTAARGPASTISTDISTSDRPGASSIPPAPAASTDSAPEPKVAPVVRKLSSPATIVADEANQPAASFSKVATSNQKAAIPGQAAPSTVAPAAPLSGRIPASAAGKAHGSAKGREAANPILGESAPQPVIDIIATPVSAAPAVNQATAPHQPSTLAANGGSAASATPASATGGQPDPATGVKAATPSEAMTAGERAPFFATQPDPSVADTGSAAPSGLAAPLSHGGIASLRATPHMPGPAAETISAQPGRIGHEAGVAIARRIVDGGHEVTLRLNPAELGRIEVRIGFEDGTLRATMRAESAVALDLLRRDSGNLSQALDQAGVRSDAGSLRFESSAGGSSHQGSGRQQSPTGTSSTPADTAAAKADLIPQSYRPIRTSGRVDLVA